MLEGRDDGRKFLVSFCHVSQNCCPTAHVNDKAEPAKQVEVEDDFGNKIYMSKEQFKGFAEKAKAGEFAV